MLTKQTANYLCDFMRAYLRKLVCAVGSVNYGIRSRNPALWCFIVFQNQCGMKGIVQSAMATWREGQRNALWTGRHPVAKHLWGYRESKTCMCGAATCDLGHIMTNCRHFGERPNRDDMWRNWRVELCGG